MIKFAAISLTAALTVVLPLSALAQQTPPGPPRIAPAPPGAKPPGPGPSPAPATQPIQLPDWFREVDTANTGVVTREQFIAYRMKLFDQLDANKDGVLTKEEFLKLAEPPFTPDAPNLPPLAQRREFYEKQFNTIDTDADGKVTRAEVQAYVALGFREFDIDMDGRATREEVLLVIRQAQQRQAEIDKQIAERNRHNPDRNGDGVIDLEEFVAFEIARMMELGADKDGKISLQEWLKVAGDPNHNPPGQPNYQQRRDALTKRFREIDTSKDGHLDQAEIRAMAVALFKKIDLDGNGKITPQEWQAANTPQQPPAQAAPKPAPRPAPPVQPRPAPKPAPAPTPGGLQPGVPLGR
ncbi:MAG: EF-hand domain-containing protein [Reyranellaceae bacterium]